MRGHGIDRLCTAVVQVAPGVRLGKGSEGVNRTSSVFVFWRFFWGGVFHAACHVDVAAKRFTDRTPVFRELQLPVSQKRREYRRACSLPTKATSSVPQHVSLFLDSSPACLVATLHFDATFTFIKYNVPIRSLLAGRIPENCLQAPNHLQQYCTKRIDD